MNDFNRREFVNLSVSSFLASNALGAVNGGATISAKKALDSFNYRGVQLSNCRLRDQYLATRAYYYNLPNDDILKGFRKRVGRPTPGNDMGAWGSEDTSMVFGQWLSGMARMYCATNDTQMRDKAVYLMLVWAKTVEPDGAPYYPTLSKELRFSHYAWDKLLGGLLDVYEYANEPRALALAERITAWAENTLDRARQIPAGFDISGFPPEWYTLPENLYRAYQLTGDTRYKAFGDLWRYEYYWGMFTGRTPQNPLDFHAYSHVNTLSSAAMTYAVIGEPRYLNTIVNAHDYFLKAQCYASGGFGPSEKLVNADGQLGQSLEREANTFETPCGSWAVVKLCRYLLQFTGEARFGDWMERILYNGIGAALPMSPDGKTFYYSDYTLGPHDRIASARKVYYWDPFPCCSGTYIQTVADYHNIIYFKDAQGIYVNLFVPSSVSWATGGQTVKIEQQTLYPESASSTFLVQPEASTTFSLKFRIPGWSQGARFEINGKTLSVEAKPGTWATVRRVWDPGDRISLEIPMRLKRMPIDKQHPNRVALVYGPVVLVQDGRYTRMPAHLPDDDELAQYIRPAGGGLRFEIAKPTGGVFAPAWGAFLPFYGIGAGIPYRMYFDVT